MVKITKERGLGDLKMLNNRTLDAQEVKIIRELIRNPRISDNGISKKTKIPVMSVNRKRKKLEEEEILMYFTTIRKGPDGLGMFHSRKLYTIKFKIGITRYKYLQIMEKDPQWRTFNSKFISYASLGEKDGSLALIIFLDAPDESMQVEEFNGKIVPFLKQKLGPDAIDDISTATLNRLIRLHHNYLPFENMSNGRINDDWPDDLIFVNEF